MGNNLQNNLRSCCSHEFLQNKKEVSFPSEKTEQDFIKGKLKEKSTKSTHSQDDYDFPLKRLDASQLEFRTNTNSKDVNRLKRLEQICPKASRLILRVLNSATLPKGTEIKINAQGVEGSFRGAKDGVTYFGSKKKSKPLTETGETSEILNDYILRNRDAEINERHRGRHFQIEYALESESYKIRDLGIGFGAFVKVDHPLLLKDNNLLSMGGSFLIINLDNDNNDSLMYTASQDLVQGIRDLPFMEERLSHDVMNEKERVGQRGEITVKIFGGPSYGEVYHFNTSTSVITIGRMPDCDIKIEDNLLSKYQASIKHIQNTGWVLYDGHNGKPSTNSNWLYLNDDFEIYDGMIFKANHTLFEAVMEEGNGI